MLCQAGAIGNGSDFECVFMLRFWICFVLHFKFRKEQRFWGVYRSLLRCAHVLVERCTYCRREKSRARSGLCCAVFGRHMAVLSKAAFLKECKLGKELRSLLRRETTFWIELAESKQHVHGFPALNCLSPCRKNSGGRRLIV